jgi:hypothetical protein
MAIYHVAIEADNETELKAFLSAGQEGLTNCKVHNWKKVFPLDSKGGK